MFVNAVLSKIVRPIVTYAVVLMILTTTISCDLQAKDARAIEEMENTLILNQGTNAHIFANRKKGFNGDDDFQSKTKLPGVQITEQFKKRPHGHIIQENKIVVNIAQHQSVEFVQQFDSQGRKVSRSMVKQSASSSHAHSKINVPPINSRVASEGGSNDLAIEHQSAQRADGSYTTTMVSSNNFLFAPGFKNWMLIASAGYNYYSDAESSDGSTAVARLALNRLLFSLHEVDIGLEAGIQNGTSLRPIIQESVIDAMGGTNVVASIKPMVELLSTFSKRITSRNDVLGFIKFGMAYRQMMFGRDTLPNISKISPDVHVGFLSHVTDAVSLMVYYQVVFGGKPNISATMYPLPANNIGTASNIPTQQGILLGIAYHF